MEPDSYVRPHRHAAAHKDETLVALRGRFGLLLFDAEGKVTARSILEPGGEFSGVDIPAGTFHSMVALQPGSVVMEAKAGPYEATTDKDWAPWAPPEGDPRGADYLALMKGEFR